MRRLVVLGAGTAGTMVVNRLRRRLAPTKWSITVVDQDDVHHYQPGYLFLPFRSYTPAQVTRSRRRFIPAGVDLLLGTVDRVDPAGQRVLLDDGRELPYDYLVVASGTTPRPDQTPGMLGPQWRRSIFDFYTFDGAMALSSALRDFKGGRLVVHITDMPIKCPVAPMEFTFLADAFLRRNGVRAATEIRYVTPLPGAFTKPVCSEQLGHLIAERRIGLDTDFMVERIDPEAKTLIAYDETTIPFDLLVTVPLNMGADFVGRSGLGDELNFVPVDRHTFLSKASDRIFALGDASNIPASKAGSVAHFAVDIFTDNFLEHVEDRPMTRSFDGHANCFIETGDRKGLLIDFNYEVEPLPGRFPVPGVGPFALMKESRINHMGKLAFRWLYWNALLPGRAIPLPADMSMAGKIRPKQEG